MPLLLYIYYSTIGDFVYGVVVDTAIKDSDQSYIKRRYKLIITDNLNIFYTFLSADKLQKDMQLQGVIESKEDMGYVINLWWKDESKIFYLSYYKWKELNEGDVKLNWMFMTI